MGDPWDKYTLDNPEIWQISHDNLVKENQQLRADLRDAVEVVEAVISGRENVCLIGPLAFSKAYNLAQDFLNRPSIKALMEGKG